VNVALLQGSTLAGPQTILCCARVGLSQMKRKVFEVLAGTILGAALSLGRSLPTFAQGDPLPSWNDTPTKQAIVEFVGRVTKAGPDFVAPAERIATFDNDGTLWVEQPMYVQMAFALDRVKTLAPTHPEWKNKEPFQSVLDDEAGRPVGINESIGRRPIAAFGNSDGDLEMLRWMTINDGARFGAIVHHTDAEREYAYDRKSHFGRLDVALDAAAVNRWTAIDMKKDWKVVFPFETQ